MSQFHAPVHSQVPLYGGQLHGEQSNSTSGEAEALQALQLLTAPPRPSRIVIATDAWQPQVNGVQRTLARTIRELEQSGHAVLVIEPGSFRKLPNPIYQEVALALPSRGEIRRQIESFAPDAVHIATEGPVGVGVRAECNRRQWPFSTGFHTLWPEYLRKLIGVPRGFTWRAMRWFHGPASAVMAPSPSMVERLKAHRIAHAKLWSRGIDGDLFHPRPRVLGGELRPILTYVGRVSEEKNIEAFLQLELPPELCRSKRVVGDGPALDRLRRRYPSVTFLGRKTGEDLAQEYSEADLFVFPSLTDTFGNVIVEALACGTPVAAFPVTGPQDILVDPRLGAMDRDLEVAIRHALKSGDRSFCAEHVRGNYTWERATRQFLSHLAPLSNGRMETAP